MANKKRYHKSKPRMEHDFGGKGYTGKEVREMKNEFYAGMDPRRRQELEDSRMIHEDHRAPANLPQHVMYHEWGHEAPYLRYHLDDTLRGIDHQVREDDSQTRRHLQKGKY